MHTLSQTGERVRARNGLMVQPTYSIADVPELDILIIPGGWGLCSNGTEKCNKLTTYH